MSAKRRLHEAHKLYSRKAHIHCYEPNAVFALIDAIKSRPIIFSGNIAIPLVKEKIDFEWALIVATFNWGGWDLTERIYWDHCLRKLWQWMRSILIKHYKRKRVPRPEHYFLPYITFLEPYLNWDEMATIKDETSIRVYTSLLQIEKDDVGAFLVRVPPPLATFYEFPYIIMRVENPLAVDADFKATKG